MLLARLLSATPQSDGEHWDLAFRWHQDVWHTDLYAQDPAPYQRNPQLTTPQRPPYPWRPGYAVWGALPGTDALFNEIYGFNVAIDTSVSPPTLDIAGDIPINAPPVGAAPQCPFQANVSASGGFIPSGSYLISVAANQSGPVSPYFISAVIPPGVTTGSITISGVVWQGAAPAIILFVGTSALTMHSIVSASWTGSSADTYGNPTAFTITNIDLDGLGLPDTVFNSFLFQAKTIVHGGLWGDVATSVGLTGLLHSILENPGWNWGVNQWTGYVLSRYDAGPGHMNFVVASNTATTITLTTGGFPGPGVPIVMRAAAGSISASTIGDANFVNALAPVGLTVNAEIGNLIRIIAGTGANQPPVAILSNTATIFTIAGTWTATPDATSVFIVEAPLWKYSIPSGTLSNGQDVTGGFRAMVPIVGSIPLINFTAEALLIEAVTVDVNGNWSVERYAPIRELYVPALPLPGAPININSVPVTY